MVSYHILAGNYSGVFSAMIIPSKVSNHKNLKNFILGGVPQSVSPWTQSIIFIYSIMMLLFLPMKYLVYLEHIISFFKTSI